MAYWGKLLNFAITRTINGATLVSGHAGSRGRLSARDDVCLRGAKQVPVEAVEVHKAALYGPRAYAGLVVKHLAGGAAPVSVESMAARRGALAAWDGAAVYGSSADFGGSVFKCLGGDLIGAKVVHEHLCSLGESSGIPEEKDDVEKEKDNEIKTEKDGKGEESGLGDADSKDGPIFCIRCEQPFANKDDVANHKCPAEKTYLSWGRRCGRCGNRFRQREAKIRHQRRCDHHGCHKLAKGKHYIGTAKRPSEWEGERLWY